MFGYVRPLKPELLMKEYTEYRALYCGLCQTLGKQYGLGARLTLSYDLTLLAAVLLAMTPDEASQRSCGCILNPLRRKPTFQSHPVLKTCATLSVLLAWHQAGDDLNDGRRMRGRSVRIVLRRAYRQARRTDPAADAAIRVQVDSLRKFEQGPPNLAAAHVFGDLLDGLFTQAAIRHVPAARQSQVMAAAIGTVGRDLGRWIYLMDAIDDLADDTDNGGWNPLGDLKPSQATDVARQALSELEQAIDRTAALLPYRRGSGLIQNIITRGLPQTRVLILRGEKLGRV